MLSEAERRVLAAHCHNHPVAKCSDCRRAYTFTELGVDIIGRRYYFCPTCRLDFVDDLRVHILSCPSIAAALEERIERSHELIKESDRLRVSSEVLIAESQAIARRIVEKTRQSHHISPLNG